MKTGAVIRWAWQEELLGLGCHQPLARWVQQGHYLGIHRPPRGTSPGSGGCVRGAPRLPLACTLLRSLAQLAGFGRSREGRSGLLSCLTQGQQPWQGWPCTAQGGHWLHQHRLKRRRKCPCSVPLSRGRLCCLRVPLCAPGAGCERSSGTG